MFSEKDNTLPMGINCSLKSTTRTHGVILFLVSRTHTHFKYRMVQIWFLTEGTRKIESWGPGITRQGATSILTESQLSPRDSKEGGSEGGPQVLVLYQEGCPAVFQADGGAIPGNSQRCSARYKFPRRQQR